MYFIRSYAELYNIYVKNTKQYEREYQINRAIVCSVPARTIGGSFVSLPATIGEDPG